MVSRYKGLCVMCGREVYGQLVVIDGEYFIVEDIEIPKDWNKVVHMIWEDSLEVIG